jgi:hypothetical protein
MPAVVLAFSARRRQSEAKHHGQPHTRPHDTTSRKLSQAHDSRSMMRRGLTLGKRKHTPSGVARSRLAFAVRNGATLCDAFTA